GKRKRTHSPRQQESESAESIGSNSEVGSKMEILKLKTFESLGREIDTLPFAFASYGIEACTC
ncbi:hypothetical protein A2U01_0005828, partial [Trifolium medium]|nr:hypothetical protein [Trifolium medium]